VYNKYGALDTEERMDQMSKLEKDDVYTAMDILYVACRLIEMS